MEAPSDSALLDRRESSSLFLFKREGESNETATDRDAWETERRANQKMCVLTGLLDTSVVANALVVRLAAAPTSWRTRSSAVASRRRRIAR